MVTEERRISLNGRYQVSQGKVNNREQQTFETITYNEKLDLVTLCEQRIED
jgi:hypothetical protein